MNKEHIKHAAQMLRDVQVVLEREINRTPTGEDRNALTEANINSGLAEATLKALLRPAG